MKDQSGSRTMREDDTRRDLRNMLSVYLSQVNVTWGWIKGQTKRKKDYNLIQALYTCKHQSIPVCTPPHTELSSPSVSVPNHLPLATALCFYPAYNEIGRIQSWSQKGPSCLHSLIFFFNLLPIVERNGLSILYIYSLILM